MADNLYQISPLYTSIEDVSRKYLNSLSLTSQFKVSMFLSSGGSGEDTLANYLSKCGLTGRDDKVRYDFMCAEAVLPGSTFDVGEESGSRQGVIERFPTRRIFSDFNLTFYVDAEYKLIRLFEEWMNFIDPIYDDAGGYAASPAGQVRFLDNNSYYRLRYPDTYKKVIAISKFERDMINSPNVKGGGGTKDHTTLTYQFVDAFPTNITALPLSYEGSTITKTTINFSYSRYVVMSHKGDNTSNSRSQVGSGNVARDASQEALQKTIKAGDSSKTIDTSKITNNIDGYGDFNDPSSSGIS
jgi:hypothetical protein